MKTKQKQKNNWQIKKFGVGALLVVSGIIIIVGIFGFPQFSNQINLLALLSTLVVLVWYAYDTHRIANQTVEVNLRPLILRSGFIESWDGLNFSIENGVLNGIPLGFSILKNIAKDISGYIIINGKKYKLFFANNISSKDPKEELSDLEKNILLCLYENYKAENKNLPKKITEIYKIFGIEEGQYVGIIASSKYIETRGEDFLLTDDGIRLMDSDKPIEYRFESNWGWMNKGTIINAIFKNEEYEESDEDNQIYLVYSDMEGNKYFTKENKNFSQNSGRL